MTKLCFDIDCIIFDAVSVMEDKFITATHNPTGLVQEFENRTKLWGHHGKKVGGWIGLQNEMNGDEGYKAEDFTVVDGQRLREFKQVVDDGDGNEHTILISPAAGAKKIIDGKITDICKRLGTDNYFGYTGRGEVFRHELATLLPYKGNRGDLLSPLLLSEMKDYVVKHHNIELVTGIEADDACSIATVKGYKEWKASGEDDAYKVIQVAVDKDTKGTEGFHFNPVKDKEVRHIKGLGSLWLTEKGDVDGAGRMFLYYQVAVGDTTDNYKANCFSDIKWASKGGYNALKDCKTDKEAFVALVGVFKHLYPERKKVVTFRGEIEIDWLYVMQEMFNMAMMLRHDGDKIDVKATLEKLKIEH